MPAYPDRCHGCGEVVAACTCRTIEGVLPKHSRWVNAEFDKILEDYTSDNADNFRAARTTDAQAVMIYNEKKDRGCCGSMDTEVKHPDGTVYMLGFNYGH